MTSSKKKQVVVQDDNLNQAESMIQVIENAMTNPDVDILKLEKLLDVQERIMDRQAEIDFNQAMAEMQPKIPPIHKSSKGHNSDYAKYEDIDKQVRPLYTDHGFSISFNSKRLEDGNVIYYGTLKHKNGHKETAEIDLPSDTSGSKNAVQAKGSSMSYAKRYLICMLLNIVTADEDDDAGILTARITDDQIMELEDLIEKTGTDPQRFRKFMKVHDISQIYAAHYPEAVNQLKAKLAQKEKK